MIWLPEIEANPPASDTFVFNVLVRHAPEVKVPPAVPAVPPAALPATAATQSAVAAGSNTMAKGAAGALASGTNLTGGQGILETPSVAGKTLLGQ